jgi:hypothetical protein
LTSSSKACPLPQVDDFPPQPYSKQSGSLAHILPLTETPPTEAPKHQPIPITAHSALLPLHFSISAFQNFSFYTCHRHHPDAPIHSFMKMHQQRITGLRDYCPLLAARARRSVEKHIGNKADLFDYQMAAYMALGVLLAFLERRIRDEDVMADLFSVAADYATRNNLPV